jgi:hypothetical protein
MNTRLNSHTYGTAVGGASRAALSPIRSIRRIPVVQLFTRGEPDQAGGIPVLRPNGESLTPRPSWHRGALDRMQPILTRYRD